MRGFLGVVVGAVAMLLFAPTPTYANDDSLWRPDGKYTAEKSTNTRDPLGCVHSTAYVVQPNGALKPYDLCVWYGSSLQLAVYTDITNHKHYAIRVGFDQSFRNIANLSAYSNKVYLRPSDDTLIIEFAGAQNAQYPRFHVYRLADAGLMPANKTEVGVVEYQLNSYSKTSLQKLTGPDGSVTYPYYRNYAFSDNREHIVGNLSNGAIIITNTLTDETRIIAYEPLSGKIDLAISDDGRYAVIGSQGWVYDSEGCGTTYSYALDRGHYNDRKQAGNCDKTLLRDLIWSNLGLKQYSTLSGNFYFTDDDSVLVVDFPRENPRTHLMVQSYGYNPQRLDYLALGDSYSSGEGDVEKNSGVSYYTPVTDTTGGCHLSTRSYPFLLREFWGIDSAYMQSVACSGARVMPDYISSPKNYSGQGNRLADISSERLEDLQTRALDVFIPGYTPQIEFVKKYQPKTITLTGGGNDVGFAKILEYCAADPFEYFVFAYSCEYVEGKVLHQVLIDSIRSQYDSIKSTVNMIEKIAPNTRVYIVGYPSFISDNQGCALNSAVLDEKERKMINQGVTEMNEVLRSVASDTNAVFIPLEQSLVGGRLCEGSKYVTGLWINGYLDESARQNSFHPNALGHQRIASEIRSIVSDPTLDDPTQSNSSMEANPKPGIFTVFLNMVKQTVQLSSPVQFNAPDASFAANSLVKLTGFSEPTQLGSYTTDSRGGLRLALDLSSMTIGRHVLLAEGQTLSGDSIRYYQFVTIGDSINDLDGDGIKDESDPCIFIDEWYDETTNNNICKYPEEDSNDPLTDADGLATDGRADLTKNNNMQTTQDSVAIDKQNGLLFQSRQDGAKENTIPPNVLSVQSGPEAEKDSLIALSTQGDSRDESSTAVVTVVFTTGIVIIMVVYSLSRKKRKL